MQKSFNIAGPCIAGKHYMLAATERIHNEITNLIKNEQYFVLHAARQCGKTTLLFEMTDKLNDEGKFYALYCSLENVQSFPNPEQGLPAILNCIKSDLRYSNLPNKMSFGKNIDEFDIANQIRMALTDFCAELDKPLVIFFDEADCLSENTLISFLRQLRNGYINKSRIPFPSSVALVGMRNIRDYKVQIRENQETLGTASPFNIITESLTIRNFTKKEVAMLYNQHKEATGQIFENDAVAIAFEQTQGQPWLVNAIAREIIEKQLKNDYTINVNVKMVEDAIKTIILRRDVHIDQLLNKLKEERVKKIIEPMILGESGNVERMSDDFEYVKDLGLIRVNNGVIEPANSVYGEVIVRTLNFDEQQILKTNERYSEYGMPKYYKNDKIDMNLLLQDFQKFWRRNSAIWVERFQYKEAAPHLILMAFLQRVINGGDITREMALETGRLDLCVHYKGGNYPVELKILYDNERYPKDLHKHYDI
jgi:hypothetical protein